MKILITGARGLLGTPLARLLAPRHEVHALDVEELDVTDASATEHAVCLMRPDRVAHLAAWTDVDGCERDAERAMLVNATGTRNVALACRAASAPLLHVSSDYVFDGTKAEPLTETDTPHAISVYGRSKLAAEEHVRALAPRWTIVRAQSLYGSGKKSFPDAILARARAGEPLRVVADQRVSPTWAQDLASGLATLLTLGSEGVFHVANTGSCTWYECARTVLDLAGFGSVPITKTTAAEFARPAARPANSAFDCGRFERETGTAMRPWRAALAAYLATARAEAERS